MIIAAITIPVALFLLWIISGYLPTRNIAMPTYRIIEKKDDYEIRAYDSYILAETEQLGNRTESMSSGFNKLFRFISGHNVRGSKISMTSPVLKSAAGEGEKIPMTAPVIKQKEGGSSTIAFVMPPGSSLEELPRPRDPAVMLRIVPSHKVAVVTFSGVATREAIEEKAASLQTSLRRDGCQQGSAPRIALYNPPWTPPFRRRNEVMIEIE